MSPRLVPHLVWLPFAVAVVFIVRQDVASDFGNALPLDGSANVYVAGSSDAIWGSLVRGYSAGGNLLDAFVANVPVSAPTPTPKPSSQGSFVIGDGSAVVGNRVTFWGAKWAKLNSMSGGPAPDSFKGFAGSTSPNPPICGGAWTSTPGHSSGPPSGVPPFITVLVASAITKSGPTITGNISQMVIVRTDPGYGPNPGHAGTGTVVAVSCP